MVKKTIDFGHCFRDCTTDRPIPLRLPQMLGKGRLLHSASSKACHVWCKMSLLYIYILIFLVDLLSPTVSKAQSPHARTCG